MVNIPPIMTSKVMATSAIGHLTLVFSEQGLMRLQFGVSMDYPQEETRFHHVEDELEAYLKGALTTFSVRLDQQGTAFQKRVWDAVHAIPYGETRSYGQLAHQLGNPQLARAIGRAVGLNPIPILCPCHRVIGSNGRLTGYLGGIHTKEILLNLEARKAQPNLFNPF